MTKGVTIIHSIIGIFFVPAPIKSLKSGSYNAMIIKECPLGLPKSVGQNQPRAFMSVLYQKGLAY